MVTKTSSLDTLTNNNTVGIFIIGGSENGCGIARDAAGLGLSVRLEEQGNLARDTHSS